MERRQSTERREAHAFVSDDRRTGPHDRRGAEARRLDREREQEKIDRIRAYKTRDSQPSPATSRKTGKRWALLGIVLGAIIVLWLIM